ncbi:MAG: DUF2085 domain-containing protein [Anaerolineales bacterium]|nr:DUF2085 domain-containing protein [Anaerolineales bacterium]
MITVTLYTKDNCSLCETAKEDLQALQAQIPHNLALVDIDEDPELKAAYGDRVPVVQAGPYTLEAPFDRRRLQATLSAAHNRQEQLADDPKFQQRKARGSQLTNSDRVSNWLSRSYLTILNLLLFLYVGLPFLAPTLMNAGYPQLARPIYGIYGALCHQLAYRSWFLYGEQPFYPRAMAGVEGYQTFEQATGIDENSPGSLLEARRFIGNEQMGYKVAYCERDIAIYGSMLLFGLVYAASGRRLRPLPFWAWILIGIAPIALDGFSQLFSQIPGFSLWEHRESTPLLRTITGVLFGLSTAWFGFPILEDSMAETRLTTASKQARLKGKTRK